MDPPPPPPQPARRRGPWRWLLLLGAVAAIWLWGLQRPAPAHTDVDYTTALGWVRAHAVKEVALEDGGMTGTMLVPQPLDRRLVSTFHTYAPKDDRLIPLLEENGVAIRVTPEKTSAITELLVAILPWVLIIGVWLWISRRAQQMVFAGGSAISSFLKRGHKFEKSAGTRITFDDVAGLAAAKRDLSEIVEFMTQPERFLKVGAKIPRGVLLVGPPGTGKTLLVRAVAGEANVRFYSITASEFVEMYVGVGAARVRELFQEAKKNAPSIVFIDEIDAVGRARGTGLGGGHDEREQTLNQLLSELDGFERDDLTVVMAATNRPDVLDRAAPPRPLRLPRARRLPEAAARRAILEVHVKHIPLGPDVDLGHIAASTAGFSGADLANLANEAALSASRRGAERSRATTSAPRSTRSCSAIRARPSCARPRSNASRSTSPGTRCSRGRRRRPSRCAASRFAARHDARRDPAGAARGSPPPHAPRARRAHVRAARRLRGGARGVRRSVERREKTICARRRASPRRWSRTTA